MSKGASDMVLSVELVTKMQALSEGLKAGKIEIKDFVESSIPSLNELKKTLTSLGANVSTQGLKAVKNEMAAQRLENEKLRASILKSRATSAEYSAELTKAKVLQQQKTAADKEQIAALKELANQRKVSNSQAEIDAYNKAAQGSILYTSVINAETVARARLNAEAAKQAIANSTLTPAISSNIAAAAQQTSVTNTVVLSKKQLAQMLAEEKYRQQQSTAELKNNAREMLNAKGSLEQRRAALIRLTLEYDRLSKAERETASGIRLANVIRGVSDQVKELEASTGRAQRNVGNYGSALSGIFDMLKGNLISTVGPLALVTAAISSARAAISHNIEISDSFVDVQRTAKMSADEVDNLGEKLKRVNTRTSLEGLLDIGFIGGRLGVAKDDLVGFITEVDKLAVVLKKEFPGGAEAVATSLGKIISVYKITQKEGITLQDALRKTGSAFLELSHNGGAPVQFLQDFTLGTAGIAQVVKLSLPTLLAYGSVLSKAGLQASTAATGVTRFLSDLSTKREKYFAIAQLADSTLTIEKFTNLINTDAKQALELFFKGLKAGNPTTTETGDRLKTLSLNAGKVKNTVIALSEAQDQLFTSTNIVNDAYKEGVSSNHNFQLANESLAASLEKIKNAISNYFTDPTSGRALASLLNAFTDTRTAGEKLSEEFINAKHNIEENQAAVAPLIERYDRLQDRIRSVGGESNLTKKEQDDLREVTAKIGTLLPGVTTKVDQYGNAISISRDRVNELTKAQKELLLAMNRKAINTAGEDFVENQRKALLQAKIVEDMAATVGKRQGSKTMSNSDVRDQTDYLKILQGRAYESAKAIRELGGTLTAAQKKVIDYYEALDKAKKPAKTDATITGDGTNEDQTELGRTTEVIKAEIKALQEANKKLAISSAEFKANVKKINADKAELRAANGLSPLKVADPFASLEKQIKDFQNKSNLITKEGLAKDLQEWDNKYAQIKDLIAKMPTGIKRSAAVVKVDAEYRSGKANIIDANSKKVEEAVKKNQDALLSAQLGGEAKELDAINTKYAEFLKLAQGNKNATVNIEAEKAKEISALIESNGAKDLNTSIGQLADIAKEYRDHNAEMFSLALSDGPTAVRLAEIEKEKADLKKSYSDKLISQEAFQKQMAALVAKGNKVKLEPPVFDVNHFKKVADAAKESINTTLANFVDSGIAEAIGGSFSAMGSAIAEGANILTAAGEGIKSTFGQLMGEIGKQFIILGTAKIAASLLLKPFGWKMASEGAGLIALGGAMALGGGLLGSKGGASGKTEASTGTGSFSGPRFAMGIENFAGGVALVGERGPELVNLPSGADVIPNHKVFESMAGNGGSPTFVISNKIQMGELVTAIERQQRSNKRT